MINLDEERGSVARFLYAMYGWSAGWENYRGEPMPEWSALPETIREHWLVVADASAELARATDKAAPALQAAATIAAGILADNTDAGHEYVAERSVAIVNKIAEQLQLRAAIAQKAIRDLEQQSKEGR